MIYNLASKGNKCSEIQHILEVENDVTPEEMFKTFGGHMLLEEHHMTVKIF